MAESINQERNNKDAILFAFCDQDDGETVPTFTNIIGLFLATLANHLDRSDPIRTQLNNARESQQRPRENEMVDLLTRVSRMFDRIWIFLDSVDKLPDYHADRLLSILRGIGPRLGYRLFCTSSREFKQLPRAWKLKPKKRVLQRFVEDMIVHDRTERPHLMDDALMRQMASRLARSTP